jgi:hypothetical protein
VIRLPEQKALVKDKNFIDSSTAQQLWGRPGQVTSRITYADAAFSHPAMKQNPLLATVGIV